MQISAVKFLDVRCMFSLFFIDVFRIRYFLLIVQFQVKGKKKMSQKVTYAIDYKGQPADKTRTGGWLSAASILVLEACERFTTMGISANMVTYAVPTLHLPSATAANIVSNFGGAGFMFALLGGFVSDTFLGRYWTIAISILIISLGSALLSISCALPALRPPPCPLNSSSCIPANGFQVGVLVAALYVIALGQGGLKANVSGFGTDQFDDKDKKEKTKMDYFFSRFYFVISLGSLLSVTVAIYVQDNVSRSWGYGLCCFAFFFGALIYIIRTRKYRYRNCVGSPIVQVLNVLVAAIRKRKLKCPTDVNALYNDSTNTAPRIHHTDQLLWMDKAAIIDENDYESNGSVIGNRWKLCSVTKVEEVKMVVRLLPIWASTIFFWCIHSQVLTFSVEQASTMERTIGNNFLIPAGSFNTFYILGILFGAAFYDRLIIPLMKRWKGKHGFTNLQRIAIGICFSISAMTVASIMETKRLSVARLVGPNVITLPVQFYILIPQFVLVGVGEAFTYSGQLDFFIARAPKGMKSMSTGLFLSTVGLGFFVSTFIVTIVNNVTGTQNGTGWLTTNLNFGKLYYFYALLAVLSFINLIFYLLCALWYVKTLKNAAQIESITISTEEEEKHATKMEVLGACERFTTMEISANMMTYAVPTLHLPSATVANIVSNFGGAGFMFALLGGFVADSFLGRYWTIAKNNHWHLLLNFGHDSCFHLGDNGCPWLELWVFFLVGVGESFTYSGQLDFFITRAPKGIKSMSTGLFLSTVGIGFFVGTFIVTIVNKVTGIQNGTGWLTTNLNFGKLYYFYALLAVLSFINLIFYLLCAFWYVKTMKNAAQIESIVTSTEEEENHAAEMEGTFTTSTITNFGVIIKDKQIDVLIISFRLKDYQNWHHCQTELNPHLFFFLIYFKERKMSPKITYAIDYKGQLVDKTRTGGWFSAASILVVEACERFTTMAVSGNLVTYLIGTMHLPSATAATIVSNFGGSAFVLCLLGGFVADSFLGRYWTTAIAALIMALGSAGLSISAALPSLRPPSCMVNSSTCVEANGFQIGVLVVSLYAIALGEGGVKANVSGFGTDQFDEKDKKEKTKMDYFFSRFYFAISLGTLLGASVGIYVQDNVSYSWGYALPCFAFFFGTIIYLSRTRKYRYKKCVGSPIVQVLTVLVAALRKWKLKYPTNVDTLYIDSTDIAPRIQHTDQLRWLDKVAIIDEKDYETNGSVIRNRWKLCSVTKVEEVKMMVRLMPIWASTIYFWCIHTQVLTFSVEQALTMDRKIGNFLIPAGSFSVFYILGILIGSAFYDRVIIPIMKRWKGTHGFTNLQRIAIGMVFSIAAMTVASIMDTRRVAVVKVVGGNVAILPLKFYILIPQYLLVGMGEAFTYSGQLDFFITRSPKGMKSMSTGLFLSTIGLGFFVSSFLVSIINSVTGNQIGTGWLTSNINYGKLYYYYALLAILSFTNLIFYLLCATWYVRTMKDGTQIESIVATAEEEEKHDMQMKEITLTGSAEEDRE
ncbi:uncharacterized protein LOC122084944 [Macadamia integrifolia]|uniref:uncharacterized protein LOC122084944 n=1 Tax=Macadamia integrifolia TaxID=60698 RepID=UPI001C4EB797|nr:uncharacterized protein LOC122084944 [Macadamia integrifolia]